MSDIPDWLRELADESDQEDMLDDESSVLEDSDTSTADADSASVAQDPSPGDVMSAEFSQPQSEEPDELDLMDQLRSQVDAEEEDAVEPSSPATSFSLDDVLIGGLEPIQQFVLAVLLFLDVLVIGLLFLVMLGRIAI
jgi:hypothetical protein